MNTTLAKLGTVLLLGVITCVTILAILGKDPAVIMSFIGTSVIPAALTLYVGKKVVETQVATEQVVAQTNGRMTELIENNRELAEKVAVLSGAMPPETFQETFTDWGEERAPEDVDGEPGHPTLRGVHA